MALLQVLATRVADTVMLLVARWRRGSGEVPQLVAPALVVATALQGLLKAATDEPGTRAMGLREVAGQLRGMAEVVEDLAAADARYAALRDPTPPTTEPALVLELALLVVVGSANGYFAMHAQVYPHER